MLNRSFSYIFHTDVVDQCDTQFQGHVLFLFKPQAASTTPSTFWSQVFVNNVMTDHIDVLGLKLHHFEYRLLQKHEVLKYVWDVTFPFSH